MGDAQIIHGILYFGSAHNILRLNPISNETLLFFIPRERFYKIDNRESVE